MMKTLHLAIMLFGFLELLLGMNPAWSQTVCGQAFVGNPDFCKKTELDASVPPSPPATDFQKPPQPTLRYPLNHAFIYLCTDAFDGHLLDCGFSIEILKLIDPDPDPNPDRAFPRKNLGGHVLSEHDPSSHPLIEPKDTGKLIFAGLPGSSVTEVSPPSPLKMKVQTGGTVAVVLYPVPQASGDLLVEIFDTSPPRYVCGPPGCFDQVPGRGGLNRMQFLVTLHVGIRLDSQLTQTADAPFILSQGELQKKAHPENHFGTATAVQRITQIAEAYLDNQTDCKNPAVRPKCPKLSINDLSLVRGGVYDLNKRWSGDNTKGNGHWGHRTGTEVDIDRTDSSKVKNKTACTSIAGGNNRVEKAVKAVIPDLIPTVPQGSTPFTDEPISAYLCESEGRNHVYLQ